MACPPLSLSSLARPAGRCELVLRGADQRRLG
jgi:hypothetical protein